MGDRLLKLFLLGRLRAERAGRRLEVRGKKAEALLAYLALPPGRRHSRDHLSGLLWGGMGDAQARHNLRQTLAALRKTLGQEVIAADGDALYLDGATVELDVVGLERAGAIEEGEIVSGELLEGLSVQEDPFDEWLADQRARIKALACDRLGAAARSRADTGAIDEAIETARRQLALDPANEAAHHLLMTLYARGGHRSAVLRQYEQCVAALERHLGVAPNPETTRLAESVRQPPDLPDRCSIVVLPLANADGQADQEFFGIGIAEEITSALSRFGSLFVISALTAYTFRGCEPDVRMIGRELGVDYVVRGSSRRSGGRIRVGIHLVDALTGGDVWARTFERDMGDVFAVEDEIVTMLVSTLVNRVEAAAIERVRRKPTESLTAYDCYLRGKDHHHRWTKEDNGRAIEMFERAVALDPAFSLGHAWLACALYQKTFLDPDPTLVQRCLDAVQRAYRLDDADAEIHRMLSAFHLLWRDFDKAEFHIERAFALNPNDDKIVCQIGELETYSGRPEAGERWVRHAIRLNPLHQLPRYWLRLAQALYHQRRFAESLPMLGREAIRVPHQLTYRAAALASLGYKSDAAAAIEELRAEGAVTVQDLVRTLPFRRSADLEDVAAALRRAGLPD